MHRKVNSENGRVHVPTRTVVKVVHRGHQRWCFCCNNTGHIARFCPNKRSNDATVNGAQLNQIDTDAVNVAQVNRVAACIVDRVVADSSPTSRVVRSTRPSTEDTQPAGTDIVCSANREVEVEFPFSVFPRVAKIHSVHSSVNVKLSPLQYCDILVNGNAGDCKTAAHSCH